MGNYTWVFKCVSNQSTTEPSIDIVELISRQYMHWDWWFRDWMGSLSASHSELVKKAGPLKGEECRQMLLSDATFPRQISMVDAMLFFNGRKFYGYRDAGLESFLDNFGRCLPENTFMMMLGIYEGFGPVAMGWVDGKFIEMMGFEHRCFGGPSLLTELTMSLEEFLSHCDDDVSEQLRKEYRQMMEFKKEVLEPLDEVDWSDKHENIVSWLGRRGFEQSSQSTFLKESKLMGCAQQ